MKEMNRTIVGKLFKEGIISFLLVLSFFIISTNGKSQDWVIGGGIGYASFNSSLTQKVLRSKGYSGYMEFNREKFSWGLSFFGSKSDSHLTNQYSLIFGKVLRRKSKLQFPLYSYVGYYGYTETNSTGLPIDFGQLSYGGIGGIRYRFGGLNIEFLANFGSLQINKIGQTKSSDGISIFMEHLSIGASYNIDVSISSY